MISIKDSYAEFEVRKESKLNRYYHFALIWYVRVGDFDHEELPNLAEQRVAPGFIEKSGMPQEIGN